MKLGLTDKKTVINRYTERFHEFGYSPKTLGWDKGKQPLRFSILSKIIPSVSTSFSIMDIGCGFGDLYAFLSNSHAAMFQYYGIDIVPTLIQEGESRYPQNNVKFFCGDFLDVPFDLHIDYCIGSGLFNFKLTEDDNYEYIENIIKKAFEISEIGIAFDFLSDQVDYKYELTFHSNPSKILTIAYKYTRNVVLRNDYMPFEFALYMYMDESYQKEDTIFSRYKQLHNANSF